MELNSIAPNANCDLVHGKPSVFERDNDGSNIYRFNIESKMGILEGQKKQVKIGWTCCEIRIWDALTKPMLKKAIIRSVVDESAELKLVNSYNKHVLGVKVDITAVDKYKEYLIFTEDVETMLVKDFSNYVYR
ncbi:hypothetical protein AwDysgo_12860 [Bacteroidales bacterium]|nr:hypothetical protein AwDysgo_12860 [Bacteroidales bacterium]